MLYNYKDNIQVWIASSYIKTVRGGTQACDPDVRRRHRQKDPRAR